MKILIDLQAVQAINRERGIGRYSLSLVRELISVAENHEIEILLSRCFSETIEPLRMALSDLVAQSSIITWEGMTGVAEMYSDNHWRRETSERLRESFILSRQADVVYVPSLFEGFSDDAVTTINAFERQQATAVTLYDLIPWLYQKPYLEDSNMRAWYERKLNNLKRANLWLAISESSRQDAIQHLHLPEEWVVNVSCAASSMFSIVTLSIEEKLQTFLQYQLSRPFIMYTAGIDYRKNIKNLLAAYAKLPDVIRKKYQLVIVCAASDDAIFELKQQMVAFNLSADEVVVTGYISDEDLVKLYNLCEVFVFPSLYEGFGLPVLEAMACGAAVIGSNTSSLPEVIGYANALFDPLNVDEITAKLQAVLTQPDFRKTLQKQAKLQSKKFSWKTSAKKTLEAFEKLHDYQKKDKSYCIAKKRQRLAYISPLPPKESGIAYYSAELLSELTQHYAIDVIVVQELVTNTWIHSNCSIRTVAWFEKHAHEYGGRILYHIGNSPFHKHMFELLENYPGVVVLHDFFIGGVISHLELCNLKPEIWSKALYDSHGYQALLEKHQSVNLEETYKVADHYPVNLSVLQQASGIIAHSQFSFDLMRYWYGENVDKVLWEHIRLLRKLPTPVTVAMKMQVRKNLGFQEDDFIVCSFGYIGKQKLHKRLLSAWLNSSLVTNARCRLIFVGENCPGEFGKELLDQLRLNPMEQPVFITGFTSEALYEQYLTVADVAVQLRSTSRGETSKAVLDCMAYGLPTIINAHGSMAEFPQDCVCFLPDFFTEVELQNALIDLEKNVILRKKLSINSVKYVEKTHNPREIAAQYYRAIEFFIQNSNQMHQLRLMQGIACQKEKIIDKQTLLDLAEIIVSNHPVFRQKTILIDISELVQRDSGTGIQRVVKNYLYAMLKKPPEGYRVEPIYGDLKSQYRYARSFMSILLNCPCLLSDDLVEVVQGDIFLGIDLIAGDISKYVDVYAQWKQKGVAIFFMVYDLLCVLNPEFFVAGAYQLFSNWLNYLISLSDGVICISRTVAEEFNEWFEKVNLPRSMPFHIGWVHLGADVQTAFSSAGYTDDFLSMTDTMFQRPFIIMVGTIEVRKGHMQTLKAFEILWKCNKKVNLVIVGKVGWKTETLIQLLRNHPETRKHLFWFENATDEMLSTLYEKAAGCLIASEGEGFGLPLIEAAQHGLPILARDIPVFKEIAGNQASYFSGHSPENLAQSLDAWLDDLNKNFAIASVGISWLNWSQSTQQLLDVVLKNQWFKIKKPYQKYQDDKKIPDFATLCFDRIYHFNENSFFIQRNGFGGVEAWGEWSSQLEASITLYINREMLEKYPTGYIHFKVKPFFCEKINTQRLEIQLNKTAISFYQIRHMQWINVAYTIKDWENAMVENMMKIDIKMKFPDAASPASFNIGNSDVRLLSIGFLKLILTAAMPDAHQMFENESNVEYVE